MDVAQVSDLRLLCDTMSSLFLLTAPSGAGKTTFCAALADHARAAGRDVAGLLSPPVFENGVKTGILVQDLRTRETRPLAIAVAHRISDATRNTQYTLPLGHWLFSPAALAWGNDLLASSLPADLFLVDELGPLELVRGEGWTNALEALRSRDYRLGLVVVRPELVETAQKLFSDAKILTLPQDVSRILALL